MRRVLVLLAISAALTACTNPRRDVGLLRQCGQSQVWRDAGGHRWIGWNVTGEDLYRIDDTADLAQICGGKP